MREKKIFCICDCFRESRYIKGDTIAFLDDCIFLDAIAFLDTCIYQTTHIDKVPKL